MYAAWERMRRPAAKEWIWADGSAHRIVSDLSRLLGVCAVENDATIGGQEPRGESPMATTFRPYEPDQMLLLGAGCARLAPGRALCAPHVSDLVDGLDLRAFYAPYEGDGRRNAPYEPRMMVKVLLYGYATGCFRRGGWRGSWRRMWRFGCWVRGNFPSHRTLCEFRRRHLEEFKGLFVEVVCLAREMGLFEFREAVDRRDEGSGEREQAQGDELRSDARGGAAFGGGNRSAAEAGSRHRCGGRRALWRVATWRRVARGVAPSRGPVGGDCCGEGALGGGATRGG